MKLWRSLEKCLWPKKGGLVGPEIGRKTRGWCSQHRGQSPGGEVGEDARDRREDDELRGESAHAGAEGRKTVKHWKLVMIVNLDKIKRHRLWLAVVVVIMMMMMTKG